MNIIKHLFLFVVIATTAFQANAGLTSDNTCYEIASLEDYQKFITFLNENKQNVEYDNHKRYYTTLNTKLTADISIPATLSNMVGYAESKDSWIAYAGCFNGNGHTITIDLTADGASADFSLFADLSACNNVKYSVTNLNVRYNGSLNVVEGTRFAPLSKTVSGKISDASTVCIHDVYVKLPSEVKSATWEGISRSSFSGMIAYAYYNKDDNDYNYDSPDLKFDGCLLEVPNNSYTVEQEGQQEYIFPMYYYVTETNYNVEVTSMNVILSDKLKINENTISSEYYKNSDYAESYPTIYSNYLIVNRNDLGDKDEDFFREYEASKEFLQDFGLRIAEHLITEDNCWGLDVANPAQLPSLLSSESVSTIRLYMHGTSAPVLNNTPHKFVNGICSVAANAPHYEECSIMKDKDGNEYCYIENEGQFIHWITASGLSSKNVKLKANTTFDLSPTGVNINWTTQEDLSFTADFDGQGSTLKYYSQSWIEEDCYEVDHAMKIDYIYHSSRPLFDRIDGSAKIHDLTIDAYVSDHIDDVPQGVEFSTPSSFGVLAQEAFIFEDIISVENVTLKGTLISDSPRIGGLFGYIYRYDNSENKPAIQFTNCNSEIEISSSSSTDAGGFVGFISHAPIRIEGCKSTGKISSSDVSDNVYVGGFVGRFIVDGAAPQCPLISQSYTTAKLISKSSSSDPVYVNGEMVEDVQYEAYVGSYIGYVDFTDVHSSDKCDLSYGYAFYAKEGDNDNTPECNGSFYGQNGIQFIGNLTETAESLYSYCSTNTTNSYTADDFHKGYITYLLNERDIHGENWCLGSTSLLPELGTGGVPIYVHGETVNTDEHIFVNGICTSGEYQEPTVEKGESSSIVTVSNAGQMLRLNEIFAQDPNRFVNATIKLGNNIDLSDFIWHSNINLNGTFDGNGYTVKFVSKDETQSNPVGLDGQMQETVIPATGLFLGIGRTNGEDELKISNLKIEADISTDIESEQGIGALFNSINYFEGYSPISIEQVSVSGKIAVKDSETPIGKIGGFIGSLNNGIVSIKECISDVDITGGVIVGGFVGMIETNTDKYLFDFQMSSCAFHGSINITANDNYTIGSLIGMVPVETYNIAFTVKDCYATGLLNTPEEHYNVNIGALFGVLPYGDDFFNKNIENVFAYFDKEHSPTELNNDQRTMSVCGNLSNFKDGEDGGLALINSTAIISVEGYDKETLESPERFTSGEIMYLFSNVETPLKISSAFSQELGTDKYPVLAFELDEREQSLVYKTCKDGYYLNENRWEYDEETEESSFNHDYNSMHVCKYGCGHVEEGDWSQAVVIEDTEDLVNMVDNLSVLTENSVPVKVTVADNIVYSDVDYASLEVEQLQETLPQKESIGTAEKPFVGTFNGEGNDLINFAFAQNGLFGQIGQTVDENATDEEKEAILEANENIKVENLSISNGVIFNNLGNVVVDRLDPSDPESEVKTYYAAALANVNNASIEGCSYVGAISIPDGFDVNKVVPCLVGQNNGYIGFSFIFVTNLDALKSAAAEDGNKAAIIVKGNSGVGRSTEGRSKKVAANTNSNSEYDDDPYHGSGNDKYSRANGIFSNKEFASGVVAYWLNFDGDDYSGNYTCKYSQGVMTPVLASADKSNAVHKIIYQSDDNSVVSGKAFANSGSDLVINLPKSAVAVKIGDTNATLTNENKTATIQIPTTNDADVTVTVQFKETATSFYDVTPDAPATVIATENGLLVYGAEGQTCTVYALNGSVVYTSTLTSNKVALPAVNKGVYFVKVGKTTAKIVL